MERFAVIGLGRFGMRLAASLADAGAEVIAVDRNREPVERIKDHVALAVCLDATDEESTETMTHALTSKPSARRASTGSTSPSWASERASRRASCRR